MTRPCPAVLLALLLSACGSDYFQGSRALPERWQVAADSGGDDDTAQPAPCPDGLICVDAFPFVDHNDTSTSTSRQFNFYDCSSSTDESGPEVIYQVTVQQAGYLAAVIDDSTAGVDIDAHLLSALDEGACLDRGNYEASAHVEAGIWYVVADTYVSGGVEQVGPYSLTIGHSVPQPGDCSMEEGWLDRIGDGGDLLRMPATGPVVLEAHLVTVDDGYGISSSDPWPSSSTESIVDHYAMSQDATGFVMYRDESWAPQEGCEYGQGSYGAKLPVDDEAWYINMYWEQRPDAGTRMIVQNDSGLAVVAAAGYETGPGDLTDIAGVTEEIHRYLGTGHESTLTVGFAVDQDLPLGPITCE